MFHRIDTVKPLPEYKLLVKFRNGESKTYDMKPLIDNREPFMPLGYVPSLFNQVYVDKGGYGVVWNDEIDLSCDSLYEGGKPVQ
ncbi:MAG: DUF2442 domain-containing protein [Sphaerochaetaceae bacterium]|jgi:hypothetical protein|nr:DUF2442 domain-containing protein [Sphaerochaetaceae bacterium]